MIVNYLSHIYQIFLNKIEKFTARKNWQLELTILIPIIVLFFSFPSYERLFTENMINWNFPIIMTQGVFDAITVNFNGVPLLGKTASRKLLQKILFYDAEVCLSLDNDAQEDQHDVMVKMLKLGIENISFINIKQKDPNLMNRWDYWKFLLTNRRNYTQTTEFERLKEKVGQMSL